MISSVKVTENSISLSRGCSPDGDNQEDARAVETRPPSEDEEGNEPLVVAKYIPKHYYNSCKSKYSDSDLAHVRPDVPRIATSARTGSCEHCGAVLPLCKLCEDAVRLCGVGKGGLSLAIHHTLAGLLLSARNCPLCWSLLNMHKPTGACSVRCAAGGDSCHFLTIQGENDLHASMACGVLEDGEMEYCADLLEYLLLAGKPGSAPRPFWSTTPLDVESRLSVIKGWLAECEPTHEACKQLGQRVYPKRLLALKDINSLGKIRLVRTTLSTLEHYEQGILETELPKTYRDAIRVATYLGFQYLWIDALCIVQDDPHEWASEAMRMAGIYQTSQLTISASSAADSHGGLFLEPPDWKIFRASISRWSSSNGDSPQPSDNIVSVMRREDVERVWSCLKDGPLTSRGWVLQERIFACRTVHFTQDQFLWQCRSCVDTESGATGAYNLQSVTGLYRLDGEEGNQNWSRDFWWPLVEDYSKRKFTYEKDRLPAMAGFVAFIERRFSETSILGLWKGTLPFDLLWTISNGPFINRPITGLSIPSWTWLSSTRGVQNYFIPKAYPFLDEESQERYKVFLTIVRWKIEWEGAPYVSRLVSTELTLRSRLIHVEVDKDEIVSMNGVALNTMTLSLDSPTRATWVALLLVYKETWIMRSHFLVLVLSTVSGNLPTYRRIGVGRFEHVDLAPFEEVFDAEEDRTIHLV
ncbi:heterokaryon incompatibility protein-domain-containing protein [Hypoxylon crocopeplum]|nr:heterokaryon incompatibility protein-domain-containing protein [Hypoxylon crocopeplum]